MADFNGRLSWPTSMADFCGRLLSVMAVFHGRLLWPTGRHLSRPAILPFGRPTVADKSRPRPPALENPKMDSLTMNVPHFFSPHRRCHLPVPFWDLLSFERTVVHPPPCPELQGKAAISNCGRDTRFSSHHFLAYRISVVRSV